MHRAGSPSQKERPAKGIKLVLRDALTWLLIGFALGYFFGGFAEMIRDLAG